MTDAPKDRPSNVIPFPAADKDAAEKAEIVKVWEQMARIVLEKLAEARRA